MSGMPARRVIGIVQPTYLPWLPFFERMAAADVFVLLDDVEYSKNSFLNRNSVKTSGGRHLLTAPVLYTGHSHASINEIEVDEKVHWRAKHWRTLDQAYARAPYWPQFRAEIASLYDRPYRRLIDVMLPFVELMRNAFKIDTPCYQASALNIGGRRNEKLVRICRHFGGTHFIVKPGTQDYHPAEEFEPYGVQFAYLSYSKIIYPQLHGTFESMLSGLDFLFNCGAVRPQFAARCEFPELVRP